MARAFMLEDGINILGGCCGTMRRTSRRWTRSQEPPGAGATRPSPKGRKTHLGPSVASLYHQVPLRQENAYLSIGGALQCQRLQEMARAAGTRRLGRCVAMGRDQVKEQPCLDISTPRRPRRGQGDERSHLAMRGSGHGTPWSSIRRMPVLEAALKLYGGKPIINSINFEDGEAPRSGMKLARKYGRPSWR